MTKNLISLSLLDSKGFSFDGKGGVLRVRKGSDVILKGVKQGSLYLLQGSTRCEKKADIAYNFGMLTESVPYSKSQDDLDLLNNNSC